MVLQITKLYSLNAHNKTGLWELYLLQPVHQSWSFPAPVDENVSCKISTLSPIPFHPCCSQARGSLPGCRPHANNKKKRLPFWFLVICHRSYVTSFRMLQVNWMKMPEILTYLLHRHCRLYGDEPTNIIIIIIIISGTCCDFVHALAKFHSQYVEVLLTGVSTLDVQSGLRLHQSLVSSGARQTEQAICIYEENCFPS